MIELKPTLGRRNEEPLLILGLDPGSLHTGYGLVEKRGPALKPLEYGRFSFPSQLSVASRLAELTVRLDGFIARWQPQTAVMESLFHGVNTRSLIILAEARGAILALLGSRGITIREYSPAEVKKAVTGNGRADKGQVARMVQLLLALTRKDQASDTTDALALAICYAQHHAMDRATSRAITSN